MILPSTTDVLNLAEINGGYVNFELFAKSVADDPPPASGRFRSPRFGLDGRIPSDFGVFTGVLQCLVV